MHTKHKQTLSLSAWIIVLLGVSGMMGWLTNTNTDNWYPQLTRSSLTPPGPVFGIVWPILYVMIAISGWYLWKTKANSGIKTLFITQLLLNWAWTPLFFHFHWVSLSVLCIVLLTAAVISLILLCARDKCLASALLAPYGLWLCFATYLNTYIWLHLN